MEGFRKRNYSRCANIVCLNRGVHPNPLCQLCARFSRNNRACPGQYPIRSTPLSGILIYADGVVKPLSDASLWFNTCVILRADNTSRLIEEYVRMFLRRYSSQRLPPGQVEIVVVRSRLGLEGVNPALAALTTTSVQADSHRVSQIA